MVYKRRQRCDRAGEVFVVTMGEKAQAVCTSR